MTYVLKRVAIISAILFKFMKIERLSMLLAEAVSESDGNIYVLARSFRINYCIRNMMIDCYETEKRKVTKFSAELDFITPFFSAVDSLLYEDGKNYENLRKDFLGSDRDDLIDALYRLPE